MTTLTTTSPSSAARPSEPRPAADEGCRQFAAEAILQRLRALGAETEGVRQAEDAEHIHRMRVASRRLRTAMNVFARYICPRSMPRWRRGIQRITRALARARDADVQIEFLREFLDAMEDKHDRPGLKRLLLRLQQRRRRLQKEVVAALDWLRRARLPEEIQRSVLQHGARAGRRAVSTETPSIHGVASSAIRGRLEELLSFEPYVNQPARVEEHHAMRIAAKRLRYTMELFEPLFGRRLKAPLAAARKTQTLLGHIHDCDVWVANLPAFLDKEAARTQKYYGHLRGMRRLARGIEMLQEDCRRKRSELYEEFVSFWHGLQTQGFWPRLARRVCGQTPKQTETRNRPGPVQAQAAP